MDLISNLPDDLLASILSFLPVRDMVMTSALSRRWHHLWTLTPRLDLRCDQSCCNKYIIHKILRLHSTSVLLHSCLISLHHDEGNRTIKLLCTKLRQKRVAKLLISNCNLKRFNVPRKFFSLSSLEELVIEGLKIEKGADFSHLRSLRFLHLDHVKFLGGISSVIKSLPYLERLGILDIWFRSRALSINSQSLKQLEIGIMYLGSLEIYAPALESLNMDVPCRGFILHAPSLTSLKTFSSERHINLLHLRLYQKYVAKLLINSCDLMRFSLPSRFFSLSSLEELNIENLKVEKGTDFSPLCSLRFLCLREVIFLGNISAVIKSLPCLERLDILDSWYRSRALKISSESLKQLEIGIMNVVLLEIYAPVLESLTMDVPSRGFVLHAPSLTALKTFRDIKTLSRSGCQRITEFLKVSSGMHQSNDIPRFKFDHALLPKLCKLSITLNLNDIRQVIVLASAMKECLLLQELAITVKQEVISDAGRSCLPYDETEYWDNQLLLEFRGISSHLECVLIKDFTGETLELGFAKFLVTMAAVLKKLVIWHRCLGKQLEDITNSPLRASPYLDILVLPSEGLKDEYLDIVVLPSEGLKDEEVEQDMGFVRRVKSCRR